MAPNLLIINVQPDEGISVRFEAKLPGTRMQLAPVMMNFRYGTAFGGSVPEAYETLLLDAMLGDPTLFARHDFVEASWALITPVHERWRTRTGADPDLRSGRVGTGRSGECADDTRRPALEDPMTTIQSDRLRRRHRCHSPKIEAEMARRVCQDSAGAPMPARSSRPSWPSDAPSD